MIDVYAPVDGVGKKYDLFTFRNGRTAKADGGVIKCVDATEAAELELDGWTSHKAVDTEDLQKVLQIEARRNGLALPLADDPTDSELQRRADAAAYRRQTGTEPLLFAENFTTLERK